MKILILYYELAGYNIVCFEHLNKFDEVHVVAYPVNSEAPFEFQTSDKIVIHDRKKYNDVQLQELYHKVQPNILYCAGWGDQDYLKLANIAKVPTILGFDNEWEGSLRQRAAILLKKRSFQKLFDYAFVPGENQKTFALKLGFKEESILLGAYSCDFDFYNNLGNETWTLKKKQFPKRFIYVGRYIDRKGIFEMWEAFVQFQKESPSEWELWCVGAGEKFEQKVVHPKIKHFGFIQPNQMNDFIRDTGVFILPSYFEPWGVVVHEYAAAGFPLLLSDKIGAGTKFLKPGVNGFRFLSKNVEEIKKSFHKVVNLSDEELIQMGESSKVIAREITPQKWAETITDIIND